MANVIVISRKKSLLFGTEYRAVFYKDGKNVYQNTFQQEDLKYIKKAYTKDFERATVLKDWLKTKKK